MSLSTDVLIAGGGLAGLRLADLLTRAGRDYILIEGRNRLGGRVLAHSTPGQSFDLGPAWYWPGQPKMAAQVARFGLTAFDQFATGAGLFETADGQVQRVRGLGSMQGALRVRGGMGALCDAIASGLAGDRTLLNTPLLSCTKTRESIIATCGDTAITARHLVLALPPRIAARVDWTPGLGQAALAAMENTPTWMAGQAKAIAIYDQPFWRDNGLSGDAISQLGPMGEIHDASPAQGGPAAVFGFIGLPPARRADAVAVRQAVRTQLIRLFGPDAREPQDIILKDWATDPFTATMADHAPLDAHPAYGLSPALRHLWDGRLLFAGTEVAARFGGYLEGTLDAAEQAFHDLAASPVA